MKTVMIIAALVAVLFLVNYQEPWDTPGYEGPIARAAVEAGYYQEGMMVVEEVSTGIWYLIKSERFWTECPEWRIIKRFQKPPVKFGGPVKVANLA
jgi:hypothetical protein